MKVFRKIQSKSLLNFFKLDLSNPRLITRSLFLGFTPQILSGHGSHFNSLQTRKFSSSSNPVAAFEMLHNLDKDFSIFHSQQNMQDGVKLIDKFASLLNFQKSISQEDTKNVVLTFKIMKNWLK